MKPLKRRKLLSVLLSIPLVSALGCGGGDGNEPLQEPPPDLVLDGDDAKLASLVRSQFSRLYDLARNPGTTLRVGIPTGRGMEVLAFSFSDTGAANYRHLLIVRESTGEVVNLVWGWKGFLPSILLTDDRGNPIRGLSGQPIEVGFSDVREKSSRQAADWIATGVKVAAVAFALWLGAQIGRAILSALAFLAFNAMLIGLFVAAIATVSPAIEWLLRNISLQDVENFFGQLVSDIIRLFTEISQTLEHWFE